MKELGPTQTVGSFSTEELTARRDQIAARLANGAQYSEGEIRQVQKELGPESNPYTPEFAREILFVSDVYEQQIITEELAKRSGAS